MYLLGIVGLFVLVIAFLLVKKKNNQQNQGQNSEGITIDLEQAGSSKKKKKGKLQNKVEGTSKDQEKKEKTVQQQKPTKQSKKKKKMTEEQSSNTKIKTAKELQQTYSQYLYGTLSLKSQNSLYSVTSFTIKNSKVLYGNSKNELILYDLKKWKKDTTNHDRFFTSLDNNCATAVAIGTNYVYAALDFDKTIIYFEFKGGQNGVYFKEVAKFDRNSLKTDASSLYVPQSEKYIVTAGSQADTVVCVWSMKGQKLQHLNTYQIQHYDVKCGGGKILVRGWTSEVKGFCFHDTKDGSFGKLEKGFHLVDGQHAKQSTIDNLGHFALTVSASNVIKLWNLLNQSNHLEEKTIDSYEIDFDSISKVAVLTLKDQNQRYKTILVFTDGFKITICDRHFKYFEKIEGVECENIYLVGSMRNAVLGTRNKAGKLIIWNISSIIENIPEYVL